jgi:hypothetical protein
LAAAGADMQHVMSALALARQIDLEADELNQRENAAGQARYASCEDGGRIRSWSTRSALPVPVAMISAMITSLIGQGFQRRRFAT